MQILVVFFLVALAGCYGEESECFEEAKLCMVRLNDVNPRHIHQGERCKKVVSAIECVEKSTESCTGDESEDKVKSMWKNLFILEKLKELKKELCSIRGVISENESIQECFEENGDYISNCLHESVDEVLEKIEKIADQHDDEDLENRKICGLYVETSFCIMRRLEEKCGAEAIREFVRKSSYVPDRVKSACETINVVVEWGLEEDERKK